LLHLLDKHRKERYNEGGLLVISFVEGCSICERSKRIEERMERTENGDAGRAFDR